MPEPVARHVIEFDLDDQARAQRLPRFAAFSAPTAWTTGLRAGEAGRALQRLEAFGERRALVIADAGHETHVVEQTFAVVQPEQQRSDKLPLGRITEAADNAIRSALALD